MCYVAACKGQPERGTGWLRSPIAAYGMPLLIVILLVFSTSLSAQHPGRLITPDDSIPMTVVAAEAWAARYPRLNTPASFGKLVFTGTADRRCVEVDSANAVRSGEFVTNGFATYNAAWRRGFGEITWIPLHTTKQMPTLTVSAVRLDGPALNRIFVQGAHTHTDDAPAREFYLSAFHFSSRGKWMIIATAGANWGCFLHTID